MKKLLLTLTLAVTAFCGMVVVNAEEVNLKDIETNTYIIGNRIYELNKYGISIFDVVDATDEFKSTPGNENEKVPLYFYGGYNSCLDSESEECSLDGTYLKEITGPESDDFVEVDTEEVFTDGIIDATYVNNADYDMTEEKIEEMLDERIDAAAKELDKTAKDFDFESIKYNAETKTGTFTIESLKGDLAGYRDSEIVKFFLEIVESSDYIAKTATYKVRNEEGQLVDKTVDLTVLNNAKIISLAKELLATIADEDAELTYESVANRSATATFVVVCDGFEYEFDFTVEFKYDVKAVKDAEIEAAAQELDKEAKDFGFESIKYDTETKTGTFTIAELDRDLAAYRDSEIVKFFLEIVDGAKTATYKVRNEEGQLVDKTVDLTVLNNAKVIELAKELLATIADEDAELTYESVANRSAKATFVYEVNGEVIEVVYTVEFKYDVKTVKDAEIETAAKELDKEAKDFGFESIKYDAETKTGTFTIVELDRNLAAYRDSEIVKFFLEIVDGAKTATYKVRNEEGQLVDKTVDLTVLNNAKVIELAKELLATIADEDAELTYESVANRSASATFVYEVNGEEIEVVYTVKFVYDIKGVKDAEIEAAAKELNTAAKDFGFEEIKYNTETRKGTFIFSEENKGRDLAAYRDSEIVKFFLEIVDGAKTATYKVRNEEGQLIDKTVDLTVLNNAKVIELAKELLATIADEDAELTYESVANRSAKATFVYEVNGEEIAVDYTVEFLMA